MAIAFISTKNRYIASASLEARADFEVFLVCQIEAGISGEMFLLELLQGLR